MSTDRRPGRPDRRRLSRPRLPGEPGEAVTIGEAVAMVGRELGLAEPEAFTAVTTAWPELVGEAVAAHSRVRSIRDGLLDVGVDSPAWATPMRYLETDLVERASQLLGPGVVTAVRVSVEGPDAGRDARGDPARGRGSRGGPRPT